MSRSVIALALALGLAVHASSAAAAPALAIPSWSAADPLQLLPPPPARGSAAEAAELAELHDIQTHRTAERLKQAQWDQDHQDWRMYVSTLGPSFDMAKLPATAKVLTRVQRDNAAVSQRAKLTFHRIRPWAADPTLKGCTVGQKDNSFTSYPSGHTEVGFALGVTLAYLIPDKAQAILARANDYAYSRMVCGVHFRSDTVAGQALATAVTFDMLRSPRMQADLKAAHAELESAGF